MKSYLAKSRLVPLVLIFGMILLIFCGVLYNTQILNGSDYKARSLASNATAQTVEASRGIITDRNAPVLADSVVYRYRGEDEVVLWRIRGLGRLVDFLSANSLSVWALCAAAAAVCVILWLTAPRRRVRRMQEQMKKTFAACGAKYDREDENEDY